MSDEFDDIVAAYGERPEAFLHNDTSEIREMFEEWQEGKDDYDRYPTPVHQTMLSRPLLLELAHAPMYEHLIPPDGDEQIAMLVTQLVYTGMSMAAIGFDGPVEEGLDDIATIFRTLADILEHDPIVRMMAAGGRQAVEYEQERIAHNERLNNE